MWQRTTDYSWFLLMRVADSQAEAAFEKPEDDAMSTTGVAISISSTVTIPAGFRRDVAC